MSTPIENLVANVNAQTQRDTLQSIGAQQSARRQVADKASAINAIVDTADQTAKENFFNGIQGDAQAEDLLTSDNALLDKVSENAGVIEALNNSESAIRKALCRREGRDPANFADLDAIAADQALIQDIAARQESSKIAARSQKAAAAIAASQTAMQEVRASQTAMQEVAASQTAMAEIDQVDFAVRAIMCGTTTLDPTNFVNADAISQDAAAMSEIAGDTTTMGALAASQTAMQEVAFSQTAMGEVANSQPAMQEVANSQTAVDELLSDDSTIQSVMDAELVNSTTAKGAFANSNLLREFSGSINNSKSGFNITNVTHFLIDDNPRVGGSADDGNQGNLSVTTVYSGNAFQKATALNFNAGNSGFDTDVSGLFGVD